MRNPWRNYFISEADDDEGGTGADAGAAPSPDAGGDDAGAETAEDVANQAQQDLNNNDFNIDNEVPEDEEPENPDDGGEEGGEEDTQQQQADSAPPEDYSDEDPVEANTDIFASLSAEKQMSKIMELKRLYGDMYTSVDDIIRKVDNLDPEDDIETIFRISDALYNLKRYMEDYIKTEFPIRSYIENDLNYNKMLLILKGVSTIVDKYANNKLKDRED